MIAQKRYQQNEQAVSAVIGVILMVAVTIAMAAVAYAYFTGLIGASPESKALVSMSQDGSSIIIYEVTNGPVTDDATITIIDKATGTPAAAGVMDATPDWTVVDPADQVNSGDIITMSGTAAVGTTYLVNIIYSNTIVGSCDYRVP